MSHEANRRPGSNGTHAQTDPLTPPDPQVIPNAERRRFSAEYKQRILAEADACSERARSALCCGGKGSTRRTWTNGAGSASAVCCKR